MGLLILGLIFGFACAAGFFYIPVLGVLFAAVVAGMVAKSPMKGLIAGAGGAAVVAALLGQLPSATNALSIDAPGWPETLIRTLSGIGGDSVVSLSIIDTVGGFYSFVIIALAIVGAIGGLIGGIAKRD
ncbi:hypothetical protein ACFLVP_00595 [Chloroflexota bacterium]